MEKYSKLKDRWIIIERYGNITGHFGGIPSQSQIYYAYDIGIAAVKMTKVIVEQSMRAEMHQRIDGGS